MHAKKPACARKIDDVAINARRARVHTRHYSAAMYIMLCTIDSRERIRSLLSMFARRVRVHFWFARTALVHFGLHKHEYLIGVQFGLAYTRIICTYKPNMSVRTYC